MTVLYFSNESVSFCFTLGRLNGYYCSDVNFLNYRLPTNKNPLNIPKNLYFFVPYHMYSLFMRK